MSRSATDVWLIVEDNDDEFLLFMRACRRALRHEAIIHREKDGFAAKMFLETSPTAPQLIVSDLKMPRMNGLELLAWVRHQDALRGTPFVMLSSSNFERDLIEAQRLGADQYKVKPSDLSGLVHLVKELDSIPPLD